MSADLSELTDKIQDFEKMIFEIASNHMFVNINKNTLKYKNFIVEKRQSTWTSYYILKGRKIKISDTFLKVSALAVCKLHENKKFKSLEEIVKRDQLFQKNYIDSVFYKNTFKRTRDQLLKDTALWRYEISHGKAKTAKQYIDKEFYSLLR
jgi:hypothetical protein